MRAAFAGSAHFAELVLAELIGTRYQPVVVVANPDRPRGRRGTPQPPPFKVAAAGYGLPVLQPESISSEGSVSRLLSYEPDVLVVCAYGQILRQNVLDAVASIVVHPSLVPCWRGAAPVERALMAGETDLGVTTLKMTAGVDEGPVGDVRLVYVPADADAGLAYEILAPAAAEGLMTTLDRMADGSVVWREQVGEPTYAAKIGRDDRLIDWTRPAVSIVDQVRALSPHIGAVTDLLGKRTRIWRAAASDGPLAASRGRRLALQAGDGWVEVLELQQEGRSRMSAAEFLRGAGRALAAP
jgi:methionyl-tRNA formyltransferase